MRDVGTNGGQAAAFTYDLARSVVYTRQGNPAWDGQERDGTSPIRSDDLYFGNASADPQADWVNLAKVSIPQADEQQRLLANLILSMNADRKPLPRFWYLPRSLNAAVVMTGDDHGNGGTAGRFDQFAAASPPGCSLADWECIRGTSYIYPSTPLTNTQAAAYTAQGFEVGLHLTTNCADWTPASLQSDYTSQLGDFASKYTSIPAPTTNRTHCIAWSDWSTQAAVELQHGIRLDTNYYYWPPSWIQNRPGFFTGSGIPMRFTDTTGAMIDTYQAATQMTDESGQTYPFTVDSLLDKATGPEGYYGVFTINAHTDSVELHGGVRGGRISPGPRRAGRDRQADADLDRRAQRVLLRQHHVERRPAVLHRYPGRRRERPRRHGAVHQHGRDAGVGHPGRHAGHLHDPHRQRRRVRLRPRGCGHLRRHLPGRHHGTDSHHDQPGGRRHRRVLDHCRHRHLQRGRRPGHHQHIHDAAA